MLEIEFSFAFMSLDFKPLAARTVSYTVSLSGDWCKGVKDTRALSVNKGHKR